MNDQDDDHRPHHHQGKLRTAGRAFVALARDELAKGMMMMMMKPWKSMEVKLYLQQPCEIHAFL